MKKMAAIILAVLLWSGVAFGVRLPPPTAYIIQTSDCSVLTWMGTLCQDTDDGKVYKWSGAALVELAAPDYWINSQTGKISIGTTPDVIFGRDGANTLALRNVANQQIFRVYNTADAFGTLTNYERLTLTGVSGTSLNLTAETGGTGVDNLNLVLTPAGTGTVNLMGNVGIGMTPTAKLQMAAGATGAGTAPLKFTTGALNTTAEPGAFEYVDPTLYFSIAGPLRKTIPLGPSAGPITFTGPAAARSFALPDAAATILTTNAAVTVPQGGTGVASLTTAYGLLAAGTTATGNVQTLAAGATTQILVGGGASALPAWGTDLPTAVTIGSGYIYRAAGTDIPVTDGGTGVSTLALNGVLYGNAANAVGVTAIGAEGQILRVGASPFVPAWTTATYPTTVAIGDVLVATAANVIGVVSKGAAVAGVLGWNAAGTLAKYTSFSLDNTAAQFYDSVDATKLMLINPVGMTTGKTLTLKGSFDQSATIDFVNTGLSADSKTITLTFGATDDATYTFPVASATLYGTGSATITSANLLGSVSDETGSASGTPLLVFNQGPTLVAPVLGAATATSLYATGIVDGLAPVTITATSAGYTISSSTSKSGYFFTNPVAAAAAFNFTLPVAAAGLQYCIANGAAKTGVLTVYTNKPGGAGEQYIDLDGVLTANTGHLQSAGAAGDFACFVGVDATHWKSIPTKGTWTKD